MTDETGTYTIRNVAGGTYTLKASLQGFKEFVQTGVPVIVGGIVRINGKLEIGALSESVTVTVRSDDPQDRQGRRQRRPAARGRRQPAAQPVPQLSDVAEPGAGRDAAGVPERADRHAGARAEHEHQRHEPQQQRDAHRRRRQHQRVAAASRRLRRTGRDDRERQHLDQQLRRGAGDDRRRGDGRPDEVGDQHLSRLGVLLPPAGRVERAPRILRSGPSWTRASRSGAARSAVPSSGTSCSTSASWERNDERNSRFNEYTVPTAQDAQRGFQRGARGQPGVPNLRSDDRRCRAAPAATIFDNADHPGQSHQPDFAGKSRRCIRRRTTPARTTACRTTTCAAGSRRPSATTTTARSTGTATPAHQFWGKFSVMNADVMDLFYLPFEDAGGGKTTVSLWTVGQTWTLSPTLLLDANGGSNKMTHQSNGPDYGTNYGTEVFGIPGLNAEGVTGPARPISSATAACRSFDTGLGTLGNNASWTPVWRTEISYTASVNLTKVHGKHEIRTGFDFVRLTLDHWQPEVDNPRGKFTFGGGTHRHAGLSQPASAAGTATRRSCSGQMSSYGKSVQFEEMTGRENQYGSICQRPLAGEREADGQPRPALRVLPADVARRPRPRAARLQHLQGQARRPRRQSARISASRRTRACSRRASASPIASTTTRCSAPATAGRSTRCRGRGRCAASIRRRSPTATPARTASSRTARWPTGIPARRIRTSRAATSRCRAASTCARPIRQRQARHIDSWNMFVERRLPCDISRERPATSARRTNNGYADLNLNYAESGGNANRSLSARPATPAILQWARAHQVALPLAADGAQPSVQEWPPAQGRLHVQQGAQRDRRRRVDGRDLEPAVAVHRNYARAGYDRPHMLQMGFVYELPFGRESSHPRGAGRQELADQRHRLLAVRHAVHVGGDNGLLQQQGGQQTTNVTGELEAGFGEAGPERAVVRPDRVQPAGQRLGQQRPQCVPRTVELEPGLLAVPGDPDRDAAASSSAPSRRTCSTTRSGATR